MDKIKIKENIISNLLDNKITRSEVVMLFDKYVTDSDFTPQEVIRSEYIEEDKLFGKTPKEIKQYLTELETKFGVGTVEQHWSGYEDNYFVYEYKGVEGDDEIEERLYLYIKKEADKYLVAKSKREEKIKRINELEKELAKLKKDC